MELADSVSSPNALKSLFLLDMKSPDHSCDTNMDEKTEVNESPAGTLSYGGDLLLKPSSMSTLRV